MTSCLALYKWQKSSKSLNAIDMTKQEGKPGNAMDMTWQVYKWQKSSKSLNEGRLVIF